MIDEVSNEEVQPWHRLGGVEHICELRKNAQVLYSILITLLRTIYSSTQGRTFGCPNVVWRKDAQKTGIWIDTEMRWEDQRPDFNPAIYVSLGEIRYDSAPTLDREARTFMSHDAEQHYERTGTATATFIHVADKAGAACALADNTENYLSFLQDQIAQEYCFDHFTVISRQPRQKKEQEQTAGKGKYVSAVTVQFDFADAWTVKIETPILKAVDLIEEGHTEIRVAGAGVDVCDGMVEIEFGDLSTERDTPKDT